MSLQEANNSYHPQHTKIQPITISHAAENNLKSVSLEIPKNQLVVVTGVSGSGKSSLIYDVLYREAESRYLGSFSSFARQFMGKLKKPEVDTIHGLSPAVALDQKSVVRNSRSTVGTLTGIYDLLRLLFARAGTLKAGVEPFPVHRSLFSFNNPDGACPVCKGLGVEDFLDPELLVADDRLTLREGALVITAPNGYIIYSQVTLDVLDQVCRAEGFHIDIPWRELTPEQKKIILYGSDKIEIPYGKHPLESRMKWTGITAKPRELGYYKGILPVMETILQRDRNKNILRFVRSISCRSCHGTRLNDKALDVTIGKYDIAGLASLQLDELQDTLGSLNFPPDVLDVANPVISHISRITDTLKKLGLSYLTASRESTTLSGGESQRIRLANLAAIGLSGMLCIFDEPSIGLHPHDVEQLIEVLKTIRDKGNSVFVVEHDEAFIRHADWLIDVGPGPGLHGGEIIYNGPVSDLQKLGEAQIRQSRTLSFLFGFEKIRTRVSHRTGNGVITIKGAEAFNLKNVDVCFKRKALNLVTGVSGAGKSTLTNHILGTYLRNKLNHTHEEVGKFREISGLDEIGKVITVDQAPIGKTPRSNPATYTGLFDHIRNIFAGQPRSVELGFDKSRFSFNTAGGRCELCEGAGYQQIGMHYIGNTEVVCEACQGRRFDEATLSISFHEKNISQILDMTVEEALGFFREEPLLLRFLEPMYALGLGYLTLGQRSSTLSGGESQRIKLATELAKPASGEALYILDEPTTGLHQADTGALLGAIDRLIGQGHTVILIEHHPGLIAAADHIVDLGPGSGREGGFLVFQGTPAELENCQESVTARALREYRILNNEQRSTKVIPSEIGVNSDIFPGNNYFNIQHSISLKSVSTHNLQHINVTIPHGRLTVITGVSGSGKSSLAFDTIFAEGQNRFLESFSPYVRSRIGMKAQADFDEITGLTPTFAVDQQRFGRNPRSTVGTTTGIYDHYRLMFARIGVKEQPGVTESGSYAIEERKEPAQRPESTQFSFNHQAGACPVCDGLGEKVVCDEEKLITHPGRAIFGGAMDDTKTGKFYGDPDGQYMATLKTVGEAYGIDYANPWENLPATARQIALDGTGDRQYEVTWNYVRDNRQGEHHFTGTWPGLLNLVNEEYARKHADHRGESMMAIMKTVNCSECQGSRLGKDAMSYRVGGMTIAELSALSVRDSLSLFNSLRATLLTPAEYEVVATLVGEIQRKLDCINRLGLSYLTLNRATSTLSGGESQRIKLAGQLGSGLTGITYVLDEPTIGLHAKDTGKLLEIIRSLQESGNTVIVVEHDRQVILSADHIIDMGPGAGKTGGNIVATGTPAALMQNSQSVTGPYLVNRSPETGGSGNVLKKTRSLKPGLTIHQAFANNLKGFDLELPSGGIVAITGVSGSGKSTLLFDVIHASHQHKNAMGCHAIEGFEHFSRLVTVHQRTGFSSAQATPVTFTGLFDTIRNLFATLPASRNAGFSRNHFSFLGKEGRCSVCEGAGFITISMDFLPDVTSVCEKCGGSRYREEVLEMVYQGHRVSDVLDMTFREAIGFFEAPAQLNRQLRLLDEVGLGYLQLGQRLSSLSGGEAQRLVLATELMKPGKGDTLFLFEEPSAGLHFRDLEYLMRLFNRLADRGDTLYVIEHHEDMIAMADHVVELGPEGGEQGGYLVK